MRIFMMVLLMFSPMLALAEIPDANSPDAVLYANRCSACHTLPDPARLDWQSWRPMLYVMDERMQERDVASPSKDEWQAIARYLKSHAR